MRAASLAAAAAAAAATLTYTPEEFRSLGRSRPDARVTVTAALHPRNLDVLEAELAVISDPRHARYGEWMTQEAINELTAPDAADREAVRAWITSTGGRCVDWSWSLRCNLAVSDVESLLATRLTAYHHVPKDRIVHRIHPTDGYTFPAHLKGKLQFITNLRDFPTVRRKLGRGVEVLTKAEGNKVTATDYFVFVESLTTLYSVTGAPSNNASTAAPAEFQNDQSYNPADAKKFAELAGIPAFETPAAHRVGPWAPANPDLEATLDYQYLNGVAGGGGATIQPWYWTEADWQYEFVQHIAQLPDSGVPSVFSISWGWYEGDQCTVDPGQGPCSGGSGKVQSYAYVAATNAGFMAATARGISIMVSSGDSGAHGRTDGSCTSKITRPDWPTACQYITAVGATQIDIATGKPIAAPTSPYCKNPTAGQCVGSGTEIVCSTATGALIVSGGGFSNVAPQPAWQAAAIKTYLASGALIPPKADFNESGRGYPDVALLGHNYLIEVTGSLTAVDGTSCSSPVFAGLIATLNAERLNAGKKVLGFLNPVLYQIAASTPNAFIDITKGDNTCTEDGCVTGCTGYGATAGWDATTGWGSVNYANLLAAVKQLP